MSTQTKTAISDATLTLTFLYIAIFGTDKNISYIFLAFAILYAIVSILDFYIEYQYKQNIRYVMAKHNIDIIEG